MLLRSFGRREGGLEGEAPGLRDLLLEVVLGLPLYGVRHHLGRHYYACRQIADCQSTKIKVDSTKALETCVADA